MRVCHTCIYMSLYNRLHIKSYTQARILPRSSRLVVSGNPISTIKPSLNLRCLFNGVCSSRVNRVNRVNRSRVPVFRDPSAAAASLGTCFQACGSGLEVVALAAASLASQKLAQTTNGALLGAPVIALTIGAAFTSIGVPAGSAFANAVVFDACLPMAVALVLLGADVRDFERAEVTRAMGTFAVGAVGTVVGTLVAWKVVGHAMGTLGAMIASCLCASYVGGSLNFAACAQCVGLEATEQGGAIVAAAMAADNICMAAFFVILGLIPCSDEATKQDDAPSNSNTDFDENKTTWKSVGTAVLLAIGVSLMSKTLANAAGLGAASLAISAFVAGAVAAACAHFNVSLSGGAPIGDALMLVFFAALGAAADVRRVAAAGSALILFIVIQLLVHLACTLAVGTWLRMPRRHLLLASNANVGGPATAAAFASARRWPSLVRVGVFMGTMGYMLGTPVGVAVYNIFVNK